MSSIQKILGVYWALLCYHPYLVYLPFVVLLSLLLCYIFLLLVYVTFCSSRVDLVLQQIPVSMILLPVLQVSIYQGQSRHQLKKPVRTDFCCPVVDGKLQLNHVPVVWMDDKAGIPSYTRYTCRLQTLYCPSYIGARHSPFTQSTV